MLAAAAAMHDLPKYEMMKSRMMFCAHCAANMIQNVSQERSNKKLTKQDLGRIFSAAYLTIYPGNTQYTWKYGRSLAYLFYVKGEAGGKASVKWMYDTKSQDSSPFVGEVKSGLVNDSAWSFDGRLVRYKTNVDPKEIYNGLEIKENEEKVIISIGINNSDTKSFGFWMLPIKTTYNIAYYFPCAVVLTPKAGLFDENGPQ